MSGIVESPRGNRDASYVAAANPETMLALIALVRGSMTGLDKLEAAAALDKLGGPRG